MASLFISYSRVDEAFARQIAKSLSDRGASVWIDIDDIPAGMKWSTAIQQGLDSCDALIVIVSPEAMASGNVEDEWQYALDQKKPVIPIRYWPAKIHFQLSRIQYVDFVNQPYPEGLLALLDELHARGIDLENRDISTGERRTVRPKGRRPVKLIIALLVAAPVLVFAGLILFRPSPPVDITPSVTIAASSTPTRRQNLAPAELTATEAAAVAQAETEIALTDLAPTFDAQTATQAVIDLTLDSFTATPTPFRVGTLRATRTFGAQTLTAQAPTQTPTDVPTQPMTATPFVCDDALVTRLESGMLARVVIAVEGQPRVNQNVRNAPGGSIVAVIAEGTEFRITGGPVCEGGYVWWQIETTDGLLRGWTAEGIRPDTYFLEPAG